MTPTKRHPDHLEANVDFSVQFYSLERMMKEAVMERDYDSSVNPFPEILLYPSTPPPPERENETSETPGDPLVHEEHTIKERKRVGKKKKKKTARKFRKWKKARKVGEAQARAEIGAGSSKERIND